MTIHNNWTGKCPAVVIRNVPVHHVGELGGYELPEDQPQECGGGLVECTQNVQNVYTPNPCIGSVWPRFYICTQCGNVVGRLRSLT